MRFFSGHQNAFSPLEKSRNFWGGGGGQLKECGFQIFLLKFKDRLGLNLRAEEASSESSERQRLGELLVGLESEPCDDGAAMFASSVHVKMQVGRWRQR